MLIAPGYRYHCDDIWHIGSDLHRHFIIVSKVLQNADVPRRATIDPIANSLQGISCAIGGVARPAGALGAIPASVAMCAGERAPQIMPMGILEFMNDNLQSDASRVMTSMASGSRE